VSEARAGEYDDLDEVTLTERVTGHCGSHRDKHWGCARGARVPHMELSRTGDPGRGPGSRALVRSRQGNPADHESRRLHAPDGALDNFGSPGRAAGRQRRYLDLRG